MSNKLGRNDLCSCGSEKKYKKCCMPAAQSFALSGVADFEWRKLRQLEGVVVDKHLLPYVTKTLPDDVMALAVSDCLPEDLPEEIDREALFRQFLMPWIFFNWIPEEKFGLKEFDSEVTLSENYLRTENTKLSSDERRFLQAINKTYYSF